MKAPGLAVPVILLVCLGWGVSCGRQFDSARWKAVRSTENVRERWHMYGPLIDQHRLVGMTPEQVRKLLGEPDRIATGPFTHGSLPSRPDFKGYDAEFEFVYSLGAGGMFPIDPDVMAIYFKNGVVDKFCWHAT